MSRLRGFVFAVSVFLPLIAAAQSDPFVQPYAVTAADGTLQGIVWRAQGAQRQISDDNKDISRKVVKCELSLFGNDPFYDAVVRNRYPVGYLSRFTLSALRSAQGGALNLPQVNTTTTGARTGYKAEKITFGGGTTTARESRGITVEGACVEYQQATTVVTREMLNMVKRQKLWNCAAFRVTVGGAVIDDVLSFDPITLTYAPFGDLDGDGAADMALQGDSFVLEIPKFSKYGSTVFETALASTLAGSPKLLPAKVEYLDEDGLTILSLSFVVTVNGIDPSDMFFDAGAASNNVRIFTKIKRDLPVEMERKSGGF